MSVRRGYVPAILLYLLCASGLAAMGLLLFRADCPPDVFLGRSDMFLVRLVWFEVLFAILWIGVFWVPAGNSLGDKRRSGGGPIAVSGVISCAAFFSMLLLCASMFFPKTPFWRVVPVILQIAVFLAGAVCIYLVVLSQKWHQFETEFSKGEVVQPEKLVMMLKKCMSRAGSDGELKKTLKRMMEKVRYSVARRGEIAGSENYVSLVAAVISVHDKIVLQKSMDVADEISELAQRLEDTVSENLHV